jgi:hypothetical protein
MMIPVFDGEIDAYWWVLCTEIYFKHWFTPDTLKMTVVGLARKLRSNSHMVASLVPTSSMNELGRIYSCISMAL